MSLSGFVIELAVMGTETTPVEIGGIILAAGSSQRMGQPKQLLPVGGQPMVRRVTEAVCSVGLGQVVVVVGAHAEAVCDSLAGLPVEILVNPDWAEGMSTSLRAGVCALRPEIGAAFVILADQPALTENLIRALAARYQATRAPIVAPFYEGQRGNPVLFDRTLFAELLTIEGDRGGRELVRRHQTQMECVELDDPAVILDVDTRSDYEKAVDLPDR